MRSPARGALRWARSAALAVATVGLSATAHVLAGGAVPGALALGTLTLAAALVCVLATARRRGVVAIVVTMSGLQAALHEGFMLLSPMRMGSVTTGCLGTGRAGGVSHPEHLLLHSPGGLASWCGSSPVTAHATSGSWGMLLAHAVVTLVLAAALAGGERALWALGRLVRSALPQRAPVPATVRPTAPTDVVVVINEWTSTRTPPRRGPPAHVGAAAA